MSDKLNDREIIEAVRERGLDWLIQSLYENYEFEAEYTKRIRKAPKKITFKVRCIEAERLIPKDQSDLKHQFTRWKFLRSIFIMPDNFPSVKELGVKEFSEPCWCYEKDIIKFSGNEYVVRFGYQFTAWIWGGEWRPIMRVFIEKKI